MSGGRERRTKVWKKWSVLCLLGWLSWPVGASGAEAEPAVTSDATSPLPEERAQDGSPSDEHLRLCVASHERAQLRRIEGALLGAEEALKACASAECPSFLRDDCVRWRDELLFEIPSVVVNARTDDGDVDVARVSIDGKLVAETLDGRPIRLDPGTRAVTVELPSGEKTTLKIVLTQGAHNRQVLADFRTRKEPTTITKFVTESRGTPTRPIPVLAYAFAGSAAIAAGVATGFGVDALEKQSAADAACRPLCSDARSDEIRTSALVADIALGVTAGSLVAATIFYFTRPVVYVKEAERSSRAESPGRAADRVVETSRRAAIVPGASIGADRFSFSIAGRFP